MGYKIIYLGIKVKLLGRCITIKQIIVFKSMLSLVYEYFCECTIFFRITLGVCGNYVSLHRANVFIFRTILMALRVPVTTLAAMKIGFRDAR